MPFRNRSSAVSSARVGDSPRELVYRARQLARALGRAPSGAARKSAKLRVGPPGVPVLAGRDPNPALIAVFIANPSKPTC